MAAFPESAARRVWPVKAAEYYRARMTNLESTCPVQTAVIWLVP